MIAPLVHRAALCLAALAAASAAAEPLTEPMRSRNLSPMIAIFGVPAWESAPDGVAELTLSGDVANNFRISQAGEERVILDGETWRAGLVYRRRLAGGWIIAGELPLVRQSGGLFDDLIDAWHSALDLPDGNRNQRPEDELQLFYDDGATISYFRSQSGQGIGDLQLSAARGFGGNDDWLLKLTLKLPTGDEDILAGSGGTDAAVTAVRTSTTRWRGHPVGWFWGAGLLKLGEPEHFASRSRDWVALGMAGLSWQPFANVGLKGQLDFHSAFYHSGLEELGDVAVQASVGGWWAVDARRRLTLSLNEDLITRAAPDVSAQLAFTWSL
ncbi:MAG TPA: DUF3187 family protein [Gammaproteobacteria bacterium]